MTFFLGIDIGSSTTKGVVVDRENTIQAVEIIHTKPRHREGVEIIISSLLKKLRENRGRRVGRRDIRYCVGTGYGRNNIDCADKVITEITCHARGVYYFFPRSRTIIDIGGQDSKLIRIDGDERVKDFVMNEKCAAGTGRFLEAVCRILKIRLDDLGKLSQQSNGACKISSTCVVFAESEIISKLAEGVKREDVIKGIHRAMVNRLQGMVKRAGLLTPLVFTGGVAKNRGILAEASNQFGIDKESLWVPEEPRLTGALGAALFARDEYTAGSGHSGTDKGRAN